MNDFPEAWASGSDFVACHLADIQLPFMATNDEPNDLHESSSVMLVVLGPEAERSKWQKKEMIRWRPKRLRSRRQKRSESQFIRVHANV